MSAAGGRAPLMTTRALWIVAMVTAAGCAPARGPSTTDASTPQCSVREDCPDPRRQLCDETFHCVPDPMGPPGGCPGGDVDCPLGQFCSAGACYGTTGRRECTRTSQCSAADRCDTRAHYCVPNLGGCDRCTEYPELCCEPSERCDPATYHCVPASSASSGGGASSTSQ